MCVSRFLDEVFHSRTPSSFGGVDDVSLKNRGWVDDVSLKNRGS